MLTIKLKIGKSGEIRRTSLPEPKSFIELSSSLESFLELSNKKRFENGFLIKYEDDEGDLVSIYNDSDLTEALRQVERTDKKILRVTICSKRDQRRGGKKSTPNVPSLPLENNNNASAAAAAPCQGLGGMFSMFSGMLPGLLQNANVRQQAEQLINSGLIKIEQQYICDGCDTRISGDRFNCSVCESSFDFCETCFASNKKGNHFEGKHEFNTISQLDALIRTLSNGGTFDAFLAGGNATAKADPKPQLARHFATCDSCSGTILGVRSKCYDCADYDECSSCRPNSTHDKSHKFFEIEDPSVRKIPEDFRISHELQLAEEEMNKKAEQEARQAARCIPAPVVQVAQSNASPLGPFISKGPGFASAAQPSFVPLIPVQNRQPFTKLVEPTQEKSVPLTKLVAPKEEAPPQPKSSFETHLLTLQSMGFSNREQNIKLLVKNKNKLFDTIQELLG